MLPLLEDLDVDDLASLPGGYGYELHRGNLVVMPPTTFWHKEMAGRLLVMLCAHGFNALLGTGIRGERPRDLRLPDLGVIPDLPSNAADYSTLPGSAFALVAEVVSEKAPNGEYVEKARWYAEQGIPEYWIIDQAPGCSRGDGVVHLHRLTLGGGEPAYTRERSVLLSKLEVEYRSR